MTNRFDVIVDCNGNTDLIDKTNTFSALPLGFDLNSLSSDEIGKVREWIDFLNNKENYSTKQKILFTIQRSISVRENRNRQISPKTTTGANTMNKTDEASIKRIIKCYLLHHKEATAKELVQHITHNNYGIKKSLNPTGLSKHIKVWKHDNHSWFNIGTYKNNQNKTVYYLKE